MPEIPTFQVSPGAVPSVPGPPRADPGAMSVASRALAQGGAAVSEEGFAFAQRYREARRQADAADATAGAMGQLGDAAFRWSKTPDSIAAQSGFDGEAAQIKAKTLGAINDPLIKSYVTQRLDEHAIALSQETRTQSFALESSARRGALDQRLAQYAQSAAAAGDPNVVAQLTDQAQADIKGSVAAGWLHPEEGAQHQLQFASRLQENGVRKQINGVLDLGDRDPDAALRLARNINDPAQYPGLLPAARESLGRQAENVAYRLTVQATSRAQKEDAAEAKALRQTQAGNEAKLLSDVYNNKPGDIAAATQMAADQRISVQGLQAVHAAIDSAEKGHDDPLAVNDLQQRMAQNEDVHADIRQGIIDHKLSGPTASALMNQNAARQGKGDNAIDRGNFNVLKTALGGDAVEKGMLDFGNQAHVQQMQTWARAQLEWGNRVVAGGQDSRDVLADMLPRYQSSKYPPATWPAPRLGAVSSTQDVAAVWQRTKDAGASGTLSPSQLQAETDLLGRYRQFYADQDARRVATAPKPAAGDGKAKLRGVSTGDE